MMIQYNHLNLPRKVTFADGKTITWIYDATGRKLQKRTCSLRHGSTPIVISNIKRPEFIDTVRHQSERIKHISTNRTPAETTLDIIDYYNATNTKIQTAIQQPYTQVGEPTVRTNPPTVEPDRESCNIRDYVLGLEYLNEEKEGYYHEEGRINLLEGGRIEYTLKDHLGNGRVYCYHDAAENEAKTLQEAHYYPFGLPIQKLSPNFEAAVGVEVNNYQYNGKELNEDFGLHWMDYGARWYNPQINRWGQIDPLAEKFYAWSGYNYTYNNPLKHTDPNGKSPWYVNESTGEAQWRKEDVTAHIDENNTTWWNEGNTIEGVNALGNYVRGNEDGTTSNEMPAVEITGSKEVSLGEKISNRLGYDVNLELSVGPQLGFKLGKTEIQAGGNIELANFSLSGGLETISTSNVQMNVFAEAQKNSIGGGFEGNFSGPVNRIGETLSYEAGPNVGYLVGQAQGVIGPRVNEHGLGWKVEGREFFLKAIVGIKFSITPNK